MLARRVLGRTSLLVVAACDALFALDKVSYEGAADAASDASPVNDGAPANEAASETSVPATWCALNADSGNLIGFFCEDYDSDGGESSTIGKTTDAASLEIRRADADPTGVHLNVLHVVVPGGAGIDQQFDLTASSTLTLAFDIRLLKQETGGNKRFLQLDWRKGTLVILGLMDDATGRLFLDVYPQDTDGATYYPILPSWKLNNWRRVALQLDSDSGITVSVTEDQVSRADPSRYLGPLPGDGLTVRLGGPIVESTAFFEAEFDNVVANWQ
jgi:hypothetical protein